MAVLKCEVCSKEEPIPTHCDQSMKPVWDKGKEMLICWMGEVCGKQKMPKHCGKPMQVAEK